MVSLITLTKPGSVKLGLGGAADYLARQESFKITPGQERKRSTPSR